MHPLLLEAALTTCYTGNDRRLSDEELNARIDELDLKPEVMQAYIQTVCAHRPFGVGERIFN